MSLFLGPIHYMMFGKIKIAANRSRMIIDAFSAKYPAETAETVKAAVPDGIISFEGATLEQLIGDNPIHQFLQGLIDRIEVNEAALVTALLYRFPDDAEELLAKAFYDHGFSVAKQELANHPAAPGQEMGLFQNIIGKNYLEGMPCDSVSSYRRTAPETLEVTHSDCLHGPKWDAAGAPAHVMCRLLDRWVLGCAQAINPKLTLTRGSTIVDGARECRCSIALPNN